MNIYQRLTNQITKVMETSDGQVRMPWHHEGGLRPFNVRSGKLYRGINIIALWNRAQVMGFSSNIWGTYNQWQERDAQVRKGEEAQPIVFYKTMESIETNSDTGDEEIRTWRLAKMAFVFNRDQVDGNDNSEESIEPALNLNESAEHFIANTGATIEIGGTRAFYRPSTDTVCMPAKTVYRYQSHGCQSCLVCGFTA